MILSLRVTFKNKEVVLEKQVAEVLQLMIFPVFDSITEVLDSPLVLLLPFCLVDSICDALDGFEATLELCVMRVGWIGCLNQLLRIRTLASVIILLLLSRRSTSPHLHQKGKLANALDGLDEL